MKPEDTASQISYSKLKTHLDAYPDYVPEKIQALTEMRLREVPETLAQRAQTGAAYLEKTEVTALVEWKLYGPPLVYPPYPIPHPLPIQLTKR